LPGGGLGRAAAMFTGGADAAGTRAGGLWPAGSCWGRGRAAAWVQAAVRAWAAWAAGRLTGGLWGWDWAAAWVQAAVRAWAARAEGRATGGLWGGRTEQPLGAERRLGWAAGPGLSGRRGGGQGW